MKYCIFCGAENAKDADTCSVCGKTLHPQENLLKDYLYRKTKSRLRGKAEDGFISVLKNWILSHLYGVVVTISLVALAVINVNASSQSSYVRTVNEAGRPDTWTAAPVHADAGMDQGQIADLTVTQDDIDEVAFLLYQYGYRYFEAVGRARGAIIEDDDDSEMDRASMEECLVPASYGYSGAVEYYELDMHANRFFEIRTTHGEPMINEPTTELGRRILADGHPVMEYIAVTNYEGDNGSAQLTFKYVAAKLDGVWYFAEILEQ